MTLAERTYEKIKEDIINLKYEVNEMLSEQMMAEKYKVSKTTAREALGMLNKEDFLIKYPSRGYFIKDVCLKEFEEIRQLRLFIERGVVEIIIDNCTDEEVKSLYDVINEKKPTGTNFYKLNRGFHYSLAKLTGNRRLCDILNNLVCSISRPFSYINYGKNIDSLQNIHKKIVDAILNRDKKEAVRLIELDISPNSIGLEENGVNE